PRAGADLAEARAAWRSGRYDDAIARYRRALDEGAGPDARRDLIRVLAEVGRYDEAVEVGLRAPAGEAVEVATALGEVFYQTGRLEQARESFARAVQEGASDAEVARLNEAIREHAYGDRAKARRQFDAFIDLYNGSTALAPQALIAVARAVWYLSPTDWQLAMDALKAFDEAIELDPTDPLPHVYEGELFLEKFDGTEADASFRAALALNPRHPAALLGLAKAMEFNGSPGVLEQVERAIEANPNYVPARVMKARLHIMVGRHADARAELEKALAVNPTALDALTMLAASQYLSGERKAYERTLARVHDLSPRYPELFNALADLSVQSRKYKEATDFARRAIALDSLSWRAWGLLGINLLRLGEIDEARSSLEKAFEGDRYNVWFKNTLDLLDTFDQYEVVEDSTFQLVLHDREADVLRPYVEQVAHEAFAALRARYGGFTPPLPIRLEVYPSHADFSVRTVGLAGIGALGVTFGSVVAMDSPSARSLGDFNWASTLWHELAHVFHLGISKHNVPRWFSEGLAVHEQHRARPGWGHQPSPSFMRAYNEGRILPVSRLEDGFLRPSYPEQVVHSYFVASIVFEYIEGRWGFDPILQMLHGYAEGRSTESMVEEYLGLDMEELDRSFDEYLEQRYAKPLAALKPTRSSTPLSGEPEHDFVRLARENPGSFAARLQAGRTLFDMGRLDEAEEHFRAAIRLFPEYGGRDSPYWYLAQIHRRRGEHREAAAALERLNSLNESDYRARLEQAEVLQRIGDPQGASKALDEAVTIYPYEIELHRRLARLFTELGDFDGVVRERKAIVALDPPDRARALFELARAQVDAGRLDDARRTVLRALDIAPTYPDALELLLEIRSRRGGGG
ncbi:MAG: hypothetical protein D6701_11370, partial [Gemmatimonadetes bacterium]